jgi:cell division protein FtsB
VPGRLLLLASSVTTRVTGPFLIAAIVAAYILVALKGPQGLQALLEKRKEIRQLQEQNAALTRENERRKERIHRLEESRSEQEMEIRKQLRLVKPGETTFILPEAPKASSEESDDAPDVSPSE